MNTFTVNLDVDATVSEVIEATKLIPMGLVAHINGQANAAKRGIIVPADQILEIFRPDFALRVWQADKRAGIDIPLRIHVYQADTETHVAIRNPSSVFAPYGNSELDKIAAELDSVFDNILACLTPYRQTK